MSTLYNTLYTLVFKHLCLKTRVLAIKQILKIDSEGCLSKLNRSNRCLKMTDAIRGGVLKNQSI